MRYLDLVREHPLQVTYPNTTYVGSEACNDCHHKDAYKIWQGHPHANAYDTLVTAEQDEMSPFNQHVQTLVTATRDDGAEGIGILEQLIIGPHAPSGFRSILDPA